jgi:hypothetical protein
MGGQVQVKRECALVHTIPRCLSVPDGPGYPTSTRYYCLPWHGADFAIAMTDYHNLADGAEAMKAKDCRKSRYARFLLGIYKQYSRWQINGEELRTRRCIVNVTTLLVKHVLQLSLLPLRCPAPIVARLGVSLVLPPPPRPPHHKAQRVVIGSQITHQDGQ